MIRRSSAGADANVPIIGEGSRPASRVPTHESGGSDRGAQDPIPRVTQRPTQRGSGRSRGRWLGDVPVWRCVPIQGDLKLGPRSSACRRQPDSSPAAAGRNRLPRSAIDRRRRRAGTRASDRPTGVGRTVTARTSAISGPVVVSEPAERWLLPGSTRRMRCGGCEPAETAFGRSTGRPAACSDPTRPSRRWEPGLCV
jgi:hypothetical protein